MELIDLLVDSSLKFSQEFIYSITFRLSKKANNALPFIRQQTKHA